MKKKILVIGGLVAVVVVVAGGVILLRRKKDTSLMKPTFKSESVELSETMTIWEDPAGFEFSYPEDVEIDPHEEDEVNYAHLELTSSNYEGRIIIWVQDAEHSDIEDWVEEEGGEGQVLDSELGGQPAKKVTYSDPERLVLATIDVDALVLIEMTPDEQGYWQKVFDRIVSSFMFIPLEGEEAAAPATDSTSGGGAGPQIIEEAEEVIE